MLSESFRLVAGMKEDIEVKSSLRVGQVSPKGCDTASHTPHVRPQLEFIQIIYDDIQAQHCYPFARIHKNERITPYFENSVIEEICPALTADAISICSWRLAKKRQDMFRLVDKSLSYEKLTSVDYDVAVLTPRSPSHKPLFMASQWHSPAWDKPFAIFKNFLWTDLKIKVPDELSTAIYENHFVAKREIYHDYVKHCLAPSITFMSTNPIFYTDAGYSKRKTTEEVQAYFEKTGRRDWPISPFILERLFSIYCEGKGFKIVSL